ncbi:hypothetical protein HPB50_018499 [Hyalomma asiaticum]|uniref:Uncharacterized protein n=1 Tax=Hyalomma asiaticum TaxID=266040 RepID=A0ACB7SWY8_HYAAI|nr:hypothetical protein HPB50_018499 [Hyalomma asiaticum]
MTTSTQRLLALGVHNTFKEITEAQRMSQLIRLSSTAVGRELLSHINKPYFAAAAVAPDGTALNAITVETTNACEAEQVAIALALALPQRDTIFTDSKPAALAYRRGGHFRRFAVFQRAQEVFKRRSPGPLDEPLCEPGGVLFAEFVLPAVAAIHAVDVALAVA